MTLGLFSFVNANDMQSANSSEINFKNTTNELEEFDHWRIIRHYDNSGHLVATSREWVR